MKKMNLYVSEEQIERLHAAARQQRLSVSDVVRRLLDQGLARLGFPSELGERVFLDELQQRLEDQQRQIDDLRLVLRAREEPASPPRGRRRAP